MSTEKTKLIIIFLLILLVKILISFWLANQRACVTSQTASRLATASGDTRSYLESMENFIKEGTYYFSNGDSKVYAGRLPHYGSIYFLFRLVLDIEGAYDALVLTQIAVHCVFILAMACLISRWLKRRIYFYLTVAILTVSLQVTYFNNYLSPESLAISLFGISMLLFDNLRTNFNTPNLFAIGLVLGLLGVLKPYLLPLYIVPGIWFIRKFGWDTWSGIIQIGKSTFIISLPLIMLLAPWIIRNQLTVGKFVPLQSNLTAGYNYTEADFAMRRYVSGFGELYWFWDHRSAGCYFDKRNDFPCTYQLPQYLETEVYKLKDIELVRDLYLKSKWEDSTLQDSAQVEFDRLTENFKSEKPFRYFFAAPVKLIWSSFAHSGSYFIPIEKNGKCYSSWQFVLKVFQSLLYWVVMLTGLSGLVIANRLIGRRIDLPVFLVMWLVLLFPIALRAVEWRYFMTSYPVFLIGFFCWIELFLEYRGGLGAQDSETR